MSLPIPQDDVGHSHHRDSTASSGGHPHADIAPDVQVHEHSQHPHTH
ncbi:MAG: hypothetical protein ACXWTU_04345 [Methylotenera sp.]